MRTTQAIKQFLHHVARPELAELYTPDMEVHVNVAKDHGVQKGKAFTDGTETWYPIRVPHGTKTSEPYYKDPHLAFSPQRFEGVGMTGWDWKHRRSRWVGYDFDSLKNHAVGLTDEELGSIEKRIRDIEWVTIRRSTSGGGLHLYVFLDNPVPTATHTEHAALARSILGMLSIATGMRLEQDVDKVGGILWVWHRRQAQNGFSLVKAGTTLSQIPQNWRDNIDVVSGKRTKIRFPSEDHKDVDELVIRTKRTPLTENHLRLIGWFTNHDPQPVFWWDADRGCLVCHTFCLAKAHRELQLPGVFYTESDNPDWGMTTQNCFMFPQGDGWQVFRHSKGAKEHRFWYQTATGWTACNYGVPVDLSTICRVHNGVEGRKGFQFRSITQVRNALKEMGLEIPPAPLLETRKGTVEQRGTQLFVTAGKSRGDDNFFIDGWYYDRGHWETSVYAPAVPVSAEAPDERVRMVVSSGKALGWFYKTPTEWVELARYDLTLALKASGMDPPSITAMLGSCIDNFWVFAHRPFEEEYPGGRVWNKNSAQLAFSPRPGQHPHWDLLLGHLGRSLDESVNDDAWCKDHGIETGQDYLTLWIANLLRRPMTSLPYLFFYSPEQSTGKSKFHEAIKLFMEGGRGYVRADNALKNASDFNAEIQDAVLCVVEEVNLGSRGSQSAYNKMKDWVTSRDMMIHPKGLTPFMAPNCTHWVQCANHSYYCPIFPGDTRVTMIRVYPYKGEEIPEHRFLALLKDEAPAMLYTLMKMDLPTPATRLSVPVLNTPDKREAMDSAIDAVTAFLAANTVEAPGYTIPINEAHERFISTMSERKQNFWSLRVFTANLPPFVERGKLQGSWHIANRAWEHPKIAQQRLVAVRDRLVPVDTAARMAVERTIE